MRNVITNDKLLVGMSFKTLFSKIRSFSDIGISRQQLEEIRPGIAAENHGGLLLSVRISILYYGILFVLSLFVGFMFPFQSLYVTAGALDIILYLLVRRTPKEDFGRNLILVYAFLSLILGFSVALGTYSRRSELAVAYDMFVTALPMLFLDRPSRLSAFIAGFTAFFCGMSLLFDSPDVMPHDIGNAVIISTISIMVNTYMIHTKVQKLVYEQLLFFQSEWDVMTGLRNRNSYEKRLKELPEEVQTGLVAVYADANGLHELNNDHGHAAGDQLLQAVASTLQKTFGRDAVYRIGGDEFVVLLPDAREEDTIRKLSTAQEALRSEGWEISAGVSASKKEGLDVPALIRTAEQEMYGQKRAYYSEAGHDRRGVRQRDRRPEEKK